MSKTEKTVTVSMSKGIAKIIEITTMPLFDNPTKQFIIESDNNGFSCIEKREDGYYYMNYMNPTYKFEGKILLEEKISELAARRKIKYALLSRE